MAEQQVVTSLHTTNLADVVERILDKGLVIVGDVRVNLVDVELLTIKIRLLISSVERAKEMGMDWWASDTHFSNTTRELMEENAKLKSRLAQIEGKLNSKKKV